MNDVDGAITDYGKVIELDNEYVDAYYNRGILYRKAQHLKMPLKILLPL
ncbi:MAG: tetratricopeptide repeat protein [Sphingobacteriales bacterium]|nr:tetratricopeptide repeat protein [Sphingobacteriales bacterium]